MAQDDFYVIAYKILAYLYQCLKSGERAEVGRLEDAGRLHIPPSYLAYIYRELLGRGYVRGVTLVPILGQEEQGVKLSPSITITPEGIAFLQENSMMRKAWAFLKECKEIL